MSGEEAGLAVRKTDLPVHTGHLEITDADFERVREVPNVLNKFFKNIMQEGTDYGTLPGTQKPSLWKPGAELLTKALHLAADTAIISKIELVEKTDPFFAYTAECRIYGETGYLGNGFGSSNSRETQYAYRWVFERDIPHDLSKEDLETRTTKNGGKQYRVPISLSEVFGLQNTIMKKAKKRAFVDAVLSVTGASRIFTQDIEDTAEPESVPKEAEAKELTKALTKEQLEYELRDFGDDVGVVEEQDGLKVEIRNKLPNSRFDALAALLGTYKAIKSFQGSSMYFKIRKTGS